MSSGPGGTARGASALVLSGGALKTIAHLGVVEGFRERGITFDLFFGCSGGAIIACLLAAGLPPRRVFEVFRERARAVLLGAGQPRTFGFLPSWLSRRGGGLADGAALASVLLEYLPGDTFSSLPHPLGVNAIHLRTGREVLFTGEGIVADTIWGVGVCRKQRVTLAVSASISLPIVFSPTRMEACSQCPERTCGLDPDPLEAGGFFFIDGGFRSHLPLQGPLSAGATFILAANARLEGAARRAPVSEWSLPDILHKTGDIVVQDQVSRVLEEVPGDARIVCIAPPNFESGLFDPGNDALDRSFLTGHAVAHAFLSRLGVSESGRLRIGDLLVRLKQPVTAFYPESSGSG